MTDEAYRIEKEREKSDIAERTKRKELAVKAIKTSKILSKLKEYSPEVVSTLLIGFDVPDSDIDIICCFDNSDHFQKGFLSEFKGFSNLSCEMKSSYVLGRFDFEGFEFEIYAAAIQVEKQLAYRHFRIMQRIAEAGAPRFLKAIRNLRKKGDKTEAAITHLLGLLGNPYDLILELENWDDEKLKQQMQHAVS